MSHKTNLNKFKRNSGSDGKGSVCNARNLGLIPEWGRFPGEAHGNLLPGGFHGQSSLVGYSPWGFKESDTNEWLTYQGSHIRNNRIITGKSLNIWKLNNTLLNNPWVKEEIWGYIQKYFKINENENTTYSSLWDIAYREIYSTESIHYKK